MEIDSKFNDQERCGVKNKYKKKKEKKECVTRTHLGYVFYTFITDRKISTK